MNNNLDLVVIFKRIERKKIINYIPVMGEVGIYDEEKEVFITSKGKKYKNIISGESYAFAGRTPLSQYQEKYPLLSINIIKRIAFLSSLKNRYFLTETEDKIPAVLLEDKNKTNKLFIDNDIIAFYNKYYPEIEIDKIINNTKMNINDVYEELINKIVGQDDQIKQILSSIWKQYNNEDKQSNYNMLINGSTGTGKTTIFKILEELLGIPCIIINAKRIEEPSYIENALLRLLEKADFDIDRAEHGILVIDKLEEISTNSKERHNTISKSLQELIINLLEEGIFTIKNIDNNKYRFSMDKLLIIGIGNFNNNESLRNTQVGFNKSPLNNNTLLSYGIIPELANKFPIVIEMNELTKEDYVKIIKNSTLSSINTNRLFLNSKNIEFNISDEVIKLIADIAYNRKSGAKSINEIIESSLTLAEFEIASNPNIYESLIITEDTIKDNKKYTLVKRKDK
ncbi:MAG: AAA family ATPase [Bacilli bacterium]